MTHRPDDDALAPTTWQAQRARLAAYLAGNLGDDPHAGEPPWTDWPPRKPTGAPPKPRYAAPTTRKDRP